MASPAPVVSVVVPTFRRVQTLPSLLTAVLAERLDVPWELVVVDNDPDRSAEAAVAEVQQRHARVRYVLVTEPGASAARNGGVAAATGEVIVMLDDDVRPERGFMAPLVAPVLEGRAELAGGRVVLDPTVPRPWWFSPGFAGYFTELDLGPEPREITKQEIVLTAVCAITRTAFEAAGGFDTELGPTAGQQIVSDDTGLVRAVRDGGGRVWWVPSAAVVHDLPTSRLRPGWALRRAFWQGRSDWRLDRDYYEPRLGAGLRYNLRWLLLELPRRVRDGLHRPRTWFHLLADVVRFAGAAAEGLSWRRGGQAVYPRTPLTLRLARRLRALSRRRRS